MHRRVQGEHRARIHEPGRPASLTGLDFPFVTIADMVDAQRHLIDYLGIEQLLCVAGGSMGGMQALQWVASYPERVRSAIPIATALKHSPQQIAFNEVVRQAIMADPAWREGDYYETGQPEKGLAVARMIGHITYHERPVDGGEVLPEAQDEAISASTSTRISRWRDTCTTGGTNFVKRFDANSYLYITKAMDYFDLSGEKSDRRRKSIDTRFLVISFQSDWLYPSYQSQEIVRLLKRKAVDATYCELKSTYGHDAFLVEFEGQTTLIRHFLERTYSGEKRKRKRIQKRKWKPSIRASAPITGSSST